MAQEINTKIDLSPLLTEVLETQACIKAFAKVSLTDEKYKEFMQELNKQRMQAFEDYKKLNSDSKDYPKSSDNQK